MPAPKRLHPVAKFTLQTLFYLGVIISLIYLYSYCGVGQAPFVYNEF